MTKEEAVKEIEKAFEPAFANYIITALTEGATVSDKEPTTKKDLAVDAVSRDDVVRIVQHNNPLKALEKIRKLSSVTPQEPKTGYISIDDVMSVFDDFMCGDVDEEGVETFWEMLKDKAESEVEDENDD